MNRVTSGSQVLGKTEALSAMDAFRTVTSEAAGQNFEGKDRGSLKPGELADFVILDRNPLTIPPKEIRDVRVVETVIGGEKIVPVSSGIRDVDD